MRSLYFNNMAALCFTTSPICFNFWIVNSTWPCRRFVFVFFFIPRPDCHSHPHTITRFQYDYSHKKFLIQNWATACSLLKEGLCWPSKTPWSFFVRSSPPPFSHTRRPMSGRNRIAQRLCMLFSFEPSW